MGHMDAGARDAAVRRQVAVRQEALAREENMAYFAAYVRGSIAVSVLSLFFLIQNQKQIQITI